jgi:glucose-1-phosphate thymidylyltransferase
MIYHPIRQLLSAGIEEILVVTSTDHMGDVVRCLGSGEEFGARLTYRVQEEAAGIAHALALAESFAGGDDICVILGDNVFEYSIAPYAASFRRQKQGARVLLKQVGDPDRYGVAALDELKVIEIEEKPSFPKSNFAVVGLYFYDKAVFDDIRMIGRGRRNEYEITEVNDRYISRGELQYDFCQGAWTDAGTFESLMEANRILFQADNQLRSHVDPG